MAIFTAVVMGARLSMMKNRPKFNPYGNCKVMFTKQVFLIALDNWH